MEKRKFVATILIEDHYQGIFTSYVLDNKIYTNQDEALRDIHEEFAVLIFDKMNSWDITYDEYLEDYPEFDVYRTYFFLEMMEYYVSAKIVEVKEQ